MAKAVMLQGTSSNVGKSILAAALCRILYQDGWRVVPFKAQNMALNSHITRDGGEMGRAQAVQAQACGLEPAVEMNPVLLKPTGNASSQVIVLGRPVGNMGARQYHLEFNTTALDVIQGCLDRFHRDFQVMVIEGAGSPAEVNLKARDIANMRVARMADAPVLLVADIDRGGALAAVVGTLELLEPDERERVAGIIINKFRGDLELLRPALEFLEEKTGKPVLGVVPFFRDLRVPEEDSVVLEETVPSAAWEDARVDIAVVKLPRISNFTDMDALVDEPDVSVRYVHRNRDLGEPDLVIIPGSKNTIEDMLYLEETGIAAEIRVLSSKKIPVIGICGGFQILGTEIVDPAGVESRQQKISGLGLLPMSTVFYPEKITTQVEAEVIGGTPWLEPLRGHLVRGYEIHMGRTELDAGVPPAFKLKRPLGTETAEWDGAVGGEGLVMGTYLHGIFDNDLLRRNLVNWLRERRGLLPVTGEVVYASQREERLNELARIVRDSLDMERLYRIIGLNV
ncbi:cobalamin biosynthesis protein CobQ [Clostridiales bacterium PH28_bin88]|nr:cobalamin biosynthesis protein CobQ [Clostridiales bacterium PH28_bin88]